MTATEFFQARVDNTISPMDLMAAIKSHPDNYVLVDVRNAPAHIRKEKVAGSIEIPLNELESRAGELPVGKTVVPYCWAGWCNMAAKGALTLLGKGFTVRELSGGIAAWQSLGLPVEKL